MPEKVLANPLSGTEITKAILDKIQRRLQSDCYLNPDLAYDYYSAHIKIEVRCHDVGRTAEVRVEETVTPVAELENENAALDQAEAEFEIEAAPPNEVRVDSGQPVPVLTKDADGKPTVKGIKYGRKQLDKVAK